MAWFRGVAATCAPILAIRGVSAAICAAGIEQQLDAAATAASEYLPSTLLLHSRANKQQSA